MILSVLGSLFLYLLTVFVLTRDLAFGVGCVVVFALILVFVWRYFHTPLAKD